MATLRLGRTPPSTRGERWLDRFRAADAWVVGAWEAAAAMAPGNADLPGRLRRGALECGAGLVAAAQCGDDREERRWLDVARGRMFEARYVLYLARRFGAIDARRYRALNGQLDRALKEVGPRDGP